MARGGKREGSGRPKGKPNPKTVELQDMIRGALSDAGGQKYLARQAEENPSAFMSLVSKILPKDIRQQVTGIDGNSLGIKIIFDD